MSISIGTGKYTFINYENYINFTISERHLLQKGVHSFTVACCYSYTSLVKKITAISELKAKQKARPLEMLKTLLLVILRATLCSVFFYTNPLPILCVFFLKIVLSLI